MELPEHLKDVSFESLQASGEYFKRKSKNVTKTPDDPPKHLKRENKNRPREVSSKVKPKFKHSSRQLTAPRDPRFDSLCGEFRPTTFKNNFSFIKDIRQREKEELTRKLKTTKNPEEKKKINFLLNRMKNQDDQEKKKEQIEAKKRENITKNINLMMAGKAPHFPNKKEKKINSLLEQYEELKSKGKLEKYIKAKSKKKKSKNQGVE